MSDDQEGRSSGPDETRHFSPFNADGDDDGDDQRATAAAGQNQPDDGPQSGDAWVFDRTGETPRAEAMSRTEQFPGVGGGDDATTVTPRAPQRDATSIMPPADPNWGASNPPWAGRAEVRAPRPSAGDYTDEWSSAPSGEPRGKWWMPIIVGIAALVLLALLGWGVWLIVQSSDKNTPGPAATVTVPPAPKTTAPTIAPTTKAPSATPSTTDPTDTEVTIPALKGLSRQDAQQALSRRGLASRLRFVVSDDAPANTVIDSDPAEGQEVPADTTVTLIIAVPPTTAPATTPSTTAPTVGPDDN